MINKKIIYTSGTYDLFHFGHLNILLKAKALGDYLIVGVSTDSLITKYKGIKPIISYKDRVTIIEQLKTYSAVFGNQTPIYRGKKISKRYIWSHFGKNEIVNMFSSIEGRQFLHNAFCFYRKDVLLDTPFSENLFSKEDRYWADDIIKAGKNYLYTPTIEVNHFYTTNGATWKGIG